MMATYRTPSDGEALAPAVRILLKRVRSDPALSAVFRVDALSLPPPSSDGGGLGRGFDASMSVERRDQPPPDLPHAPARGRGDKGWLEMAEPGSELAFAGTGLAKAGSNWHDLADLGGGENQAHTEKLRPISNLLEKPIWPTETDWLATREHPAQRPYWLNGASPTALASGQKCPL